MGQKSNTLTLRTYKERLDSRSMNSKEFLEFSESVNILKRSFDKKGAIIAFHSINIASQTCYLTINVFYKTQRLLKFKKYIKRKKFIRSALKLKKQNTYNLTAKIFNKTFKNKLFVLNMFLLNKQINRKVLVSLYKNFLTFKNMLFSRRFNLFMDFLKLTTLFIKRKINVNVYLTVLGTIFKILPKKMHSKFFFFLKHLINTLIKQKGTTIKGVNFVINGKLKGKLRSSTLKNLVGKIGTQTISSQIDYAKVHIFTMYGCFGFKMWVNYI